MRRGIDSDCPASSPYRDLGGLGRSYAKTREKLGRKPGYDRQLEEWASKYDWRDRTFAFDVEEDRRDSARMEERKAQMELKARGWWALIVDGELAFYCPRYARREFGERFVPPPGS